MIVGQKVFDTVFGVGHVTQVIHDAGDDFCVEVKFRDGEIECYKKNGVRMTTERKTLFSDSNAAMNYLDGLANLDLFVAYIALYDDGKHHFVDPTNVDQDGLVRVQKLEWSNLHDC